MKTEHSVEAAKKLSVRLALCVGALGLSLVANAGMALSLATMNKVVLVPTLVDTVEIRAGGAVDRDYLERLSRDAAYLFLNRTPETATYFERQLERIVEPVTYQKIKSQLIADRQKRRDTKTSQAFFPTEWFIKPGSLYVEVSGRLQTSDGMKVLENETRFYALRFVRQGSTILLSSFEEIEPKDRQGARAKIANEAP